MQGLFEEHFNLIGLLGLLNFFIGCKLIDKAWESFNDVQIRDRSLIW